MKVYFKLTNVMFGENIITKNAEIFNQITCSWYYLWNLITFGEFSSYLLWFVLNWFCFMKGNIPVSITSNESSGFSLESNSHKVLDSNFQKPAQVLSSNRRGERALIPLQDLGAQRTYSYTFISQKFIFCMWHFS